MKKPHRQNREMGIINAQLMLLIKIKFDWRFGSWVDKCLLKSVITRRDRKRPLSKPVPTFPLNDTLKTTIE